MESGYRVRPSRVSPTPPCLGVLHRDDPVAFARRHAPQRCRMDGRDEDDRARTQPQRELVGEGPFGAERDDRHWFTMHSIRASVRLLPLARSKRRGAGCPVRRIPRMPRDRRDSTISERSPRPTRHAASTSGHKRVLLEDVGIERRVLREEPARRARVDLVDRARERFGLFDVHAEPADGVGHAERDKVREPLHDRHHPVVLLRCRDGADRSFARKRCREGGYAALSVARAGHTMMVWRRDGR